MKKINILFRAAMKKAALPVAAVVAATATPAFAAVRTEITDAISSGTDNYGAVTAGVITIAALGFCVGMMVSWLKK